jgi:hypothetical protein
VLQEVILRAIDMFLGNPHHATKNCDGEHNVPGQSKGRTVKDGNQAALTACSYSLVDGPNPNNVWRYAIFIAFWELRWGSWGRFRSLVGTVPCSAGRRDAACSRCVSGKSPCGSSGSETMLCVTAMLTPGGTWLLWTVVSAPGVSAVEDPANVNNCEATHSCPQCVGWKCGHCERCQKT